MEYRVAALDDTSWRIDETLNGLHVYAHLLEGTERALLIDTCQGLGNLRGAVRRLTDKPVDVVNTHGHLDHIGSNYQFDTVYIHPNDIPVAQEHGDAAYRLKLLTGLARELNLEMTRDELARTAALPQTKRFTPLQDGQVLELGGRRLRVLFTPGHTPGSVCLLEADKKWLFTGDTVCDQGVLLSLPHSCPVQRFFASLKSLKSQAEHFDTLHPGHHKAPLDNRLLDLYLACCRGIMDKSITGIPGVSAGHPALMGMYGGIAIAYQPDNIFE